MIFNVDQSVEALSAAAGGVVATILLYPLEIIKNLMNSTSAEEGSKGFMQVVSEINKSGVVAAFYRGCTASSIQSHSQYLKQVRRAASDMKAFLVTCDLVM